MPSFGPQLPTDQQRFARAGRFRFTTPAPLAGDQAWLRPPSLPSPTLPVARRPVVRRPTIVKQSTLSIRGANNSQWQIIFGDGHQFNEIDLTHYHLHVDIGHKVFDLTGILPDAIGIDLNGAGSFSLASAMYGANILWHTRGENNNLVPEVHLYKGLNAGLGVGTITTPMDASVSASLFIAWASKYDKHGNKTPAPNSWVANGFNWTGYFYTAALSIPTPWGFNAVGSYFSSDKHLVHVGTTVWWGISIGISKSLGPTDKMPSQVWDIAKWLRNNSSLNLSRTEYYLVFGNGKDYILDKSGKETKSIAGWQRFINQNDYNK